MREATDPLTLKGVMEWLDKLIGFRLTSVNFVMDYLILDFDGEGAMTTLVWPAIIQKEEQITYGMDQYRNQLCSLIGCTVKTARITSNDTIIISFSNGNALHVPLQSYELKGERVILTAPKHFLLVL